MWYLLKAELQYNKSILIALAISLFAYTAFSLLNYQLLEGPRWEIDYWGGILGIIFYLTLFIIWSRRIKEFRARIFSITPTTINKIASARLFLVLILTIMPPGRFHHPWRNGATARRALLATPRPRCRRG